MEKVTTELILVLVLFVSGDAVHPGCECLVYSGTYGKEVGVFSSPDYPRPYSSSIDCLLYTFIAGKDEIIEITFKDFDVHKPHLECEKGHYLKVYLHAERAQVDEHTIWSGLLCGGLSDIPHVLYSSGPGLVLEFHTIPTPTPSNATGFIGTFRFIDRRLFKTDGQMVPGTVCDFQFYSTELSTSTGHFYSPRYPSSYPKNIRCAYKFHGRNNERIRIVFEEVMLQKGDISCLNRADVVRVHDGRGASTPVIREVCNEVAELEVLSTGSELFIEFLADSQWPGQGFKASYQFQLHLNNTDSNVIGQNGPSVSASASWTSCNRLLDSDSAKSGTIISPGYPGPYPPRSSCRYDFQGRGKERVRIAFTDFSLYHPTDNRKECESVDAVMVYMLVDGRLEKVDSFCGSVLPPSVMSNGPRLQVQFHGLYSSGNARGFKATYSFTDNFGMTSGRQLSDYTCGFSFNSTVARTGTISSPNFPGNYPRDTECHYFFYGEPYQRVRLHFLYFDVEGVQPCEANSASDYVEFSDVIARDEKFPRSCGQLQSFFVQSETYFFRMTFRSNDRLDGVGFNATYRFFPADYSSSNSRPTHTSNALLPLPGLSVPTLLFLWLLTDASLR